MPFASPHEPAVQAELDQAWHQAYEFAKSSGELHPVIEQVRLYLPQQGFRAWLNRSRASSMYTLLHQIAWHGKLAGNGQRLVALGARQSLKNSKHETAQMVQARRHGLQEVAVGYHGSYSPPCGMDGTSMLDSHPSWLDQCMPPSKKPKLSNNATPAESKKDKVYLVYKPKSAQSNRDHITIDQYDVYPHELDILKHTVENTLKQTLPHTSGKWQVCFKGNKALIGQDLEFGSDARAIEIFRQRAAKDPNTELGSFKGYSDPEQVVTGAFLHAKVAIVSCHAVGTLRKAVENEKWLSSHRGQFMPLGKYIGHMTHGQNSEAWPTVMKRLRQNIKNLAGKQGGVIELGYPPKAGKPLLIRRPVPV